jgi:4-carboxymuconolactone decarboxylase
VSSAPKPRIEPLSADQLDDDAQRALRAGMPQAADRFLTDATDAPDAPRLANALGLLLRHPKIAGPWLIYNSVLLGDPTIDARHRELAILRVAWRTGSEYEWVQHVRIAKQHGVTDDEVKSIAGGTYTEGWTPAEADLLTATDELFDDYRIGDDTWERLTAHFDERQLLELTFVVGTYLCLALAFNTAGLELDPDLDVSIAPVLPEGRT